MKRTSVILVVSAALGFAGCESVKYMKSELTGTAKPEGGVQETVPVSKTYGCSAHALRQATIQVLTDQGYIFEENPSTGTIKTEPKPLDANKSAIFGANYSAKVFIRLEGATVAYQAKYDKKSNITMGEQNVEYPEKEAALRKEFFAALDQKLSSRSSSSGTSNAAAKKASALPASSINKGTKTTVNSKNSTPAD